MILRLLKKCTAILYHIVVFLIPLNLGKHFILKSSYVEGRLVDYLIPTVYLTDILIFVLLFIWILNVILEKRSLLYLTNIRFIQVLIFFIFAAFLSAFESLRFNASIYFVGSLVLYFGLVAYVLDSADINLNKLYLTIGLSAFFVSFLGILQFYYQHSVFNNYLLFGEQSYSWSTFDIAKKAFFGVTKLPSYGTFRHPNIFGGYLSVVLVWVFYSVLRKFKHRIFFAAFFIIGVLALVYTLSYAAYLSFIFGILFILFGKRYKRASLLFVLAVVIISVSLIFMSKFAVFKENTSIIRRSDLIVSASGIISDNIVFGVGVNGFTSVLPWYSKFSLRPFYQPVHNIFILVFAETGIFGFLFFTYIFYLAIYSSYSNENPFYIAILQFIILGSFDHYVFTINQTQLLFWLTVALLFKYNLKVKQYEKTAV